MERKTTYAGGQLLFFVYDGPRVVQFVMNLGFGHLSGECRDMFPMATDLGYHSPVPMYEGHTPMDGDCEWTGGACYYDGTSLGAAEPMRILMDDGDEALFKFLEDHWRRTFEGGEAVGFGELVSNLMGRVE